MKAEFEGDGTKVLVGLAEAGTNDVLVWVVLPMHQRVASLFMLGVSSRIAVELYRKLHILGWAV